MLSIIPEELLIQILTYVLQRDSPFVIDVDPGPGEPTPRKSLAFLSVTNQEIATASDRSPHPHNLQRQTCHIDDWIFVNSVCRRIRRVGRPLFFATKTIAMQVGLPRRLSTPTLSQVPGFARILKDARPSEDFLLYVRDVVLLTALLSGPPTTNWNDDVPEALRYMPALQRCTFFLAYTISGIEKDGPKGIAAAVAISKPVEDEFRSRLLAVGVPARIEVLETGGTEGRLKFLKYRMHRKLYPILDARALALQNTEAALVSASCIG
ncbi:hypothetical protein GGR57DRAFT_310398 [Xylariaceae sp. FL1272]|nr:hypothetical protein GGR57DRAFT_310398 [Xylariaceae sp. FL1272]